MSDRLFDLRIRLGRGSVRIRATDDFLPLSFAGSGITHNRVNLSATYVESDGTRTIVKGWVGIPCSHSIDGEYARLSAIGYFAHADHDSAWLTENHSPEEAEVMRRFCDELSMVHGEREARYERSRRSHS